MKVKVKVENMTPVTVMGEKKKDNFDADDNI